MAINQNFLVKNGLSVGTGGTYLFSSGSSFGIGTTTPSSALQVIGTVTGNTFSGSGSLLTSIPNSALNNSSVTINTGTGLTGGGSVSLGGSLTLVSTGVTSLATSGIGISVSGSTGAVTISSGATSINTVNTIVSRDSSGNFTAGTITANLTGTATTSTNVSGGLVTASAGSSISPSVTFIGNTSSGLYSPGSGLFAISTGSTERIRVNNLGFVGIGTTNPSQALHVVGNSIITGARYDSNNTGGTYGQVLTSTGTGTSWNGTITISSGSSIGIGTTTPTTPLSVNGYITENPGDGVYWNVVTQKDIGIAGNQIPLNQYLGTMAFQDANAINVNTLSIGVGGTVLFNSGQYIGIGTTNPTRVVQIVGDATSNPFNAALSVATGNTSTGYGAYLGLNATSLTNGRDWRIVSSGTSNSAGIGKFSIYDNTATADRVVVDSNGNVGIGTTTPSSKLTVSGDITATSLNSGPISGTRNRIINGWMAIDQRNAGAGQTFTAGTGYTYCIDRWYAYSLGGNVTGQRVGTPGSYNYQFTGGTGVTTIGFGQRMEAINTADLAGKTISISANLANSLSLPVTWTLYSANTLDTFGTFASPTKTAIATGTFTPTGTLTRFSTGVTVSAGATTGLDIIFSVGSQTSGTWTIGNVQIELGTAATPFEVRSYGQELALCQRYYEIGLLGSSTTPSGSYSRWSLQYKVTKRASPTNTYTISSGVNSSAPTVNIVTSDGSAGYSNGTAVGDYTIWTYTSQAEL